MSTSLNFIKKARRYMFSPIPKEHVDDFYRHLVKNNYWPTIFVGTLILIVELAMIFVNSIRTHSIPETRSLYFTLYLLLFGVTLLLLLGALMFRSFMMRRPRIFMGICGGYGLFICLWGGFMSAYSHRNIPNISVFIYISLCVSIVVNYRPLQAVIVYFISLLFFYLVMFHYIAPEISRYGSVLNSLIVALLCISVSITLYRTRAINYINRVTIMKQNEQIKTINAQLRHLVLTDNLTEAHNRRYFDEVLPEKLSAANQRGEDVCAMMLDIDHFKEYNDIYGHQSGDVCLQSISQVLRRHEVEGQGALVRYGGEEFVLFLPACCLQTAKETAEAIRRDVEALCIPHTGCSWGKVTISVGVCCLPPDENPQLHQLVHGADIAMYTAKNNGRNRVCVHKPGMQAAPRSQAQDTTRTNARSEPLPQ